MSESCFLNYFNIIHGNLPTWDCTPQLAYPSTEHVINSTMNVPMFQLGMETFFVCVIGLLGVIIVELIDSKFLYLIDPVCQIIERRHDFVIERNRLNSMNGHP